MTSTPRKITLRKGPWTLKYEGGRLADVFHAEAEDALDCIDVLQDGDAERVPNRTELRHEFTEWIAENGATFTAELPYLR